MNRVIKIKELGIYIIMFLIFLSAFRFNLFGEDNGSNTTNFDLFSDEVILSDILYSERYEHKTGFIHMVFPLVGSGMIKEKYVGNSAVPKKFFSTYYSQIGFHGKVYRVADKISPFSNKNNLRIFYLLNATLLSILLIYIIKWVESNFGRGVAIGVFFMLAFFAPDLNQFGRNLYWVGWILFLPMCASIFTINLINRKKKLDKFWPLLWFASAYLGCLIKFLCYYEFTSTVMVCMMIPYILFLLSNTEWKLKTFIINCMFPTLGAIGAFLTSLIIKFLAIYRVFGNKKDAWNIFIDPIRNRITGNTIRQELSDSINAPTLGVIKDYINRVAFSIGGLDFFYRDLIILFILFSFIGYYIVKNSEENKKKVMGLISILWISIIAPFSWFILAKPHAFIHKNQCSVLWYLPFVILGWILVFYVAKLVIIDVECKKNVRH